MTRLIDADSIPWLVEGVGEIPVITKDEIDQLPTVNMPTAVGESVGESVGVIRCKDCKYWDGKYHYCEIIDDSRDWDAYDYCSVAERKEE